MFGLDESLLFAPTDLDVTLTPQAVEVRSCSLACLLVLFPLPRETLHCVCVCVCVCVQAAVARQEYSLAVNMALHLGEEKVRVYVWLYVDEAVGSPHCHVTACLPLPVCLCAGDPPGRAGCSAGGHRAGRAVGGPAQDPRAAVLPGRGTSERHAHSHSHITLTHSPIHTPPPPV